MAASTKAYFLYPPAPGLGAGHINPPGGGLHPENSPAWLWGQGTPAAIPPFTTVNKGALYSEVNATDDNPNLWMKVDEGGDTGDWILVGNTGVISVRSLLYDISAADSEQVLFHAVTACQVIEAGLMYEEATTTTGAAEGDMTIGTASGGGQIVAAASYATAQASGSYQALTIASGALAAGTSVFASHDTAAAAVGTVRVLLKIRVEA